MKKIVLFLLLSLCFSLYGLDGDVDGNGVVDIVDALRIGRYSVGLSSSPFIASEADVTADGEINIIDALMVAQYWVEFIPYFTCSLYKKLGVPELLQESNKCGPTSALMYTMYERLKYLPNGGTLPTQTALYNEMRIDTPNQSPGVTIIQLRIVLNPMLCQYTTINDPSYTAIYSWTDSAITSTIAIDKELQLINRYEPSIVFWYDGGNEHFVVMIGFNYNTKEVLFNDPAYGKFRILKLSDWLTKEYIVPTRGRTFIGKKL